MCVRKETRHGRPVLIIDFLYRDKNGAKQRYRARASVQTISAARTEDARLQRLAAETGMVSDEPEPVHEHEHKTFAEFIERWRTDWAPRHKPSTRERYEDLLKQGLLAEFGSKRLDAIGAADFRAYESKLIARKIQTYPHLSLLRSILRAAYELSELDAKPTLPSARKPKTKLPSCPAIEEIDQTVAVARGWLRDAVALGVFAGLRSGELRALQVRHVDLRRGDLHIAQAFSASEVTIPKGGTDRIVPIDPRLHPILAETIAGKDPTAFVVVRRSGQPPKRQHIWTALRNLQDKHGMRHRSVHSMRHAFCTYLLQRGADIETVRVIAGHEDIKTTARYVHGNLDAARRAMASWIPLGSKTSPG